MDKTIAYLLGALHDGYIYTGKSKGKVAVFTQKNRGWLENIKKIVLAHGKSAWIFRQRQIFVIETKLSALFQSYDFDSFTDDEKHEFVSGFFDAEGGIPLSPADSKPLYIQFVQKKPEILLKIMNYLGAHNISCGKLHMYDKGRSDCWRFFVSSASLLRCVKILGDWVENGAI